MCFECDSSQLLGRRTIYKDRVSDRVTEETFASLVLNQCMDGYMHFLLYVRGTALNFPGVSQRLLYTTGTNHEGRCL